MMHGLRGLLHAIRDRTNYRPRFMPTKITIRQKATTVLVIVIFLSPQQ
jgi:hypothetical protein